MICICLFGVLIFSFFILCNYKYLYFAASFYYPNNNSNIWLNGIADNEVLNTILSEKSLYCERHQIKLTCIADGAPLDFISTMDMYALLGNALDNAIEAVSKCRNIEKRIVSLTISAKDSFLSIQINNYYEGEIKFCDGLPISTKRRNRAYHGFGMKSIRHLTEKYGGTLVTDLEDDVFTLQIILPMPKEFIRLLKEKKNQEICQ